MNPVSFLVACLMTFFVSTAYAIPAVVTKSITAQNTFSDAINPSSTTAGVPTGGSYPLNVSVSGVAGGSIVTLQRSFDSGSTWVDVERYTANAEKVVQEVERTIIYRAGVKAGEFGSGTVVIRLARP